MAFVRVREKERKGYKLALARRAQQGHDDAESRMPNRSCPSFQFARVAFERREMRARTGCARVRCSKHPFVILDDHYVIVGTSEARETVHDGATLLLFE